MSETIMTKFSAERCLADMPYETLFEIFRRLPKAKLIETSKLCSKLKGVAGDTHLWKDVCIKYKPIEEQRHAIIAFEELYSEPWPVKVVDMSEKEINPPVSSKIDQVVKVTKLILSSTIANKITTKAILGKYQCTELYLDFSKIDLQGRVMGIAPKAFSKQTALEVLSLKGLGRKYVGAKTMIWPQAHQWLAQVLSNCKNLKTLDLSHSRFTTFGMECIAKNLPNSLEKLLVKGIRPADSFFELLARTTPNLKELGLCPPQIKCLSLLKFQFLKALHVNLLAYDISDLCTYLIKFPALKTVYTDYGPSLKLVKSHKPNLIKLRTTLKPHGIIVEDLVRRRYPKVEGNLWMV